MDLFERLTENDVNALWKYMSLYGGPECLPQERMNHFLRYWNIAKEPFFEAFGEQFIIKKNVTFEKSVSELKTEMYDMVYKFAYQVPTEFVKDCKQRFRELNLKNDILYRLEDMFCSESLVYNIYRGESFTIPAEVTVDGRDLRIQSGCKIIKIIGKICNAINFHPTYRVCKGCGKVIIGNQSNCYFCSCDEVEKVDGYETFRNAHSVVLNQKKLKGNLCLSIHPLDFITMSDNNCGWHSCMQWMDTAGDYRLGTIEMMNSNCVVIAYLEATTPMEIDTNIQWNNKKWRQLFIVTPDLILGNRQYPYDNDDLQGAAITWLREICSKIPGWGPYADKTCQIKNHAKNVIKGDEEIYFSIDCDNMYNDVYDLRLAFLRESDTWRQEYYLNFSGPAICTGCGCEIEYSDIDPSRVNCQTCEGGWRCVLCGSWHSDFEECHEYNGGYICEYCYYEELDLCHWCGERVYAEDLTRIYLQLDIDHPEVNIFNFENYIDLCPDCFNDIENICKEFGEMKIVSNHWGRPVNAFDITKITDEGFDRCCDIWERSFLKRLRDAETDEERIKLIENHKY